MVFPPVKKFQFTITAAKCKKCSKPPGRSETLKPLRRVIVAARAQSTSLQLPILIVSLFYTKTPQNATGNSANLSINTKKYPQTPHDSRRTPSPHPLPRTRAAGCSHPALQIYLVGTDAPVRPYRPFRRGRCPCCGARNFCAALRRTLEILTAATRSLRFIRHWRRSVRSPHRPAPPHFL